MTPGTYIRLRREAAGMTIADVVGVLGGGGLLSAELEQIESDDAVPTGLDAALLSWAFALDDMVVAALKEGEDMRICRECGCTQNDPCEQRLGLFCGWAEADLCTACTPVEKELRAHRAEIDGPRVAYAVVRNRHGRAA